MMLTPAALAARRLASVVSMLWLRIRRPAILMTEQKLQKNGHPRRVKSEHGDHIAARSCGWG